MKARNTSALYNVLAVVAAGILMTGCASGHKQFAYVVGQGTNEVFTFRAGGNGALTPLGAPNGARHRAALPQRPRFDGEVLRAMSLTLPWRLRVLRRSRAANKVAGAAGPRGGPLR